MNFKKLLLSMAVCSFCLTTTIVVPPELPLLPPIEDEDPEDIPDVIPPNPDADAEPQGDGPPPKDGK